MNVLEKTGLQYFWNKIKTYIGTQISGFWKEGQIYKCGQGTVDLDISNMRDPKIYSYSGSEKKACILGHFHPNMVGMNRFSISMQDNSAKMANPVLIELIPYIGILLGRSNSKSVEYITPASQTYQTYVGRGVVSVSPESTITNIVATGRQVKLTTDGIRAIDRQGAVTINDNWAKSHMNDIATCDATMVDAKILDIDYGHKIATVRITIQDTEGQYFYVKAGGTVIGGSISSAVDGEYYANVVLQVPYDSSGNVSLQDKYAITL